MNGQLYNQLGCNNSITGNNTFIDAVEQVIGDFGVQSDLNMNEHRIVNCAGPLSNHDVVNLEYFNTHGSGGGQTALNIISNSTPNTGDIYMNGYNFTGMAQANSNGQAVEYSQFGTQVSSLQTQINTETTNRTNADTALQSQITTNTNNIATNTSNITALQSRTLNQIATANPTTATVDLNHHDLDNLNALRNGGNIYATLSTTNGGQFNISTTARQIGSAPSMPNADGSQLIPQSYLTTYVASQVPTIIQNTSIQNMLPPTTTTGSTSNPVVIVDTGSNLVLQASTKSFLQEQTFDQISTSQLATGDIDANGQKITNLADPVSAEDAVNLQTMEAAISSAGGSYLPANSSLATIASTNASSSSITASNQRLTNLANATTATDGLNRQTADGRYYLGTTPLNQITTATADVSLGTHQLTGVAPGTYTDSAVNLTQLNNLSTVYMPKTESLDQIAQINPTAGSVSLNNQKITNLLSGSSNLDAVNYAQLQAFVPNKIQHSSGNASLTCSGANEIDIRSNGVNLGYFYEPTGQGTTPLGIYSNDKFEMTSHLNSFSLYGDAAQSAQPVANNMNCSISCPDDQTKNINCQLQIYPASSSSQALTLASGHVNQGSGMQQYSIIYNKSPDGVQQTLAFSGGTPEVDATINCFSNSFATTMGYANKIQFTDKVGYSVSPAVTVTDANQFTSKSYVDTAITGKMPSTNSLAQIATANASASSITASSQKITNLGNATTATDAMNQQSSDARYYLNTTALNSITAPTAAVSLNNQNITNLLDPTTAQMAATKNYVDTHSGTLNTLNYIATNYPTSADWSNNSYKITNLATPTVSSDACTKGYADGLIVPSAQFYSVTLTSVAAQTNYTITHSLGADLNGLNINVFVQFKANTDGWTTTDWLQIESLDQILTSAGNCSNYQFGSNSANPTNSFIFSTANRGIGYLVKSTGNYNNANYSNFNFMIVVVKNNGQFLVTSSTYGTSNLIANANIDMLSAYKVVNLPNPSSSGDAVTLGYLGTQNYQTQTSADARYYLNTVPLNNITQATGLIDVGANRITGLANALVGTDATNRTYVDNAIQTAQTQINRIIDTTNSSATLTCTTSGSVIFASVSGANQYFSMGNFNIRNLAQAVNNNDAVNLLQMNNAIGSYVPSQIQSSDATSLIQAQTSGAIAVTTNHITQTGSCKFIANSNDTSGSNNTQFIMVSGSSASGLPTNTEAAFFVNDSRGYVATTNTRYALLVNSNGTSTLSYGGNAIQTVGLINIQPQTIAGQNSTTSVLLSVNGTAQAYAFNTTGPSRREIKKNIREYTYYDLLNVSPVSYKFSKKGCKKLGIDYIPGESHNGFILQDVPSRYHDSNGVNLKKSDLERDLLYMLVEERKRMSFEIDFLKDKLGQALQRLDQIEGVLR